jgi:hypothetical protein
MEWWHFITGAAVGIMLGVLQRPLLPLVIDLHRGHPQWHLPQIGMVRIWQPRLYRILGFNGKNETEQFELLTERLYRFAPLILGFVGAVVGGFIGSMSQ